MRRMRRRAVPARAIVLLLALVMPVASVLADDDRRTGRRDGPGYENEDGHGSTATRPGTVVAGPATPQAARNAGAQSTRGNVPIPAGEANYREECGSCHLAYPSGMLPAASWRAIMADLDHHFGQNAELDPQATAALTQWLVANAAEAGTHPLSRKVLRSLDGAAPLRISEVPVIAREHRELRPSVWSRPAIGSVANCGACHTDAEQGDFDEDRISIPK